MSYAQLAIGRSAGLYLPMPLVYLCICPRVSISCSSYASPNPNPIMRSSEELWWSFFSLSRYRCTQQLDREQQQSHQWHSKLYDKKVAMVATELKLNKFPDPASKLSTGCKYGVITSLLHRYNVACTRRCDFLVPAQQLHRTYIQKRYHRQKVHQYFGRFLRRHVPHYQPARILRQWHQP